MRTKKRHAKYQAKRTHRREILAIAVFVVALLVLLSQIKTPANLYDEGLVLVNAERIRHGEIPYRDFWTIYAPGYFYALAALFSVFEPTVLAARLFDTVLRVLLTLEVYFVASATTSRRVALVPAAFAAFWLGTIRSYLYPAFPATAAILLAALALARYLGAGQLRWLFVTGLAVGLTAVLRLDFGGYAAVGFGFAAALYQLRLARDGGLSWRSRLVPVVKAELGVAAGALLAAVPLYAYLAVAAGYDTIWNDLVVFPATIFRVMRHLPVPSLVPELGRMTAARWIEWLQLYVPLATYLTAVVVALRWLKSRSTATGERLLPVAVLSLALTGTGLGLVVKATARYDAAHAIPMTICAAIVATTLAYWLPGRLWRSSLFRVGFVAAAVVLLGRPYVGHFMSLASRGAVSALGFHSNLPRAGCVQLSRVREAVAKHIRARTSPGDFVFVGSGRHDLIFVNDLLLQFLIDRPSPTRYSELHPGLATTFPVQAAITQELTGKDVRWVVRMKESDPPEPNASSISSGVTLLDDYIKQHYRLETEIGHYEIWMRTSP